MGKLVHLTIPVDTQLYKGKDYVLVEHIFNYIKGNIHSGTSDHPTLVQPGVAKEDMTGIVTISAREVYITSKICGRSNIHHDDPEYIACTQRGVKIMDHAKDSYVIVRKLGWCEYHWRRIKSFFHKKFIA
jgi:hypothetical protein